MPSLTARGLLVLAALALLAGSSYLGYRIVSDVSQDEIRISSNPWVGFTPFIYAQEKGWLDDTPFHFVWQVDLTENVRLFERGFTQGFTATQYEMLHAQDHAKLKPVFLIDRSDGADVILSNRTLPELKVIKQPITVYLERGSLQSDIFHAFTRENHLDGVDFELLNAAQKSMTEIQPGDAPLILISYAPYASQIMENGFKIIASTHTLTSFNVIDALFVDKDIIAAELDQFLKLKQIYIRAVHALQHDPEAYYETIHGYLEGQTFAQFMQSTREIEWFVQPPGKLILQQLRAQGVETDQLLP